MLIEKLFPATLCLVFFTRMIQPSLGQGSDPNGPKKGYTLEEYRRQALTAEGDVTRGQQLFSNESRLACSKCHSVDGKGGKAGPDLFAAGDKFTRGDLIAAIL